MDTITVTYLSSNIYKKFNIKLLSAAMYDWTDKFLGTLIFSGLLYVSLSILTYLGSLIST